MSNRYAILNRHPTLNVLGAFLFYVALTGLFATGAAYGSNELSVISDILLILMIPVWIFLGPTLLGQLLASLLRGSVEFAGAKKAIDDGFVPSYIGRNHLCVGFCMVDEPNRRLFINRQIVPFAAVKSVRADGNRISVTLSTGDHPVQNVRLRSHAAANQFYARLCNSLGI